MTATREIVGAYPPPTRCQRVFLDSSRLYLAGISPPEQTQGQLQRRPLVMIKVPAPAVPSIASQQSLHVNSRTFSCLMDLFRRGKLGLNMQAIGYGRTWFQMPAFYLIT
jgi:hypothetical protein